MGLFGAALGWKVGAKRTLPKICHIYPSMIKLGKVISHLKKIQEIYKSPDISTEFC